MRACKAARTSRVGDAPGLARERRALTACQWPDRGQSRHGRGRDRVARHLDRRRQPARERAASMASRISSSIWPSRARSGGAPATSPRRSRRSAASSMPRPASTPPPITRACCQGLAARPRHPGRHHARPRFDRAELERERDVILQEIAAALDMPEDIVFDLLQEAAFPDQPIGRPILGTARERRQLQRADLGAYLSTHYHGPNMVLSAAGDVDHASLVAEAERPLAAFDCGDTARAGARDYAGASRRSDEALRAEPSRARLRGAVLSPAEYFTAQVFPGRSAAACPRACSRRCASGAGFAMRSTLRQRPIR